MHNYLLYSNKLLAIFLLIYCFSIFTNTYSQSEVDSSKNLTIVIGDTILFTNLCDSGSYKFIDLYTKTRYEDSILKFNPSTGEGFYKTFFQTEGDFDSKRLGCSYANSKFTTISTQYFEDKNTKEERFIVFVMLEDWRKVAWIEFIDAYQLGEIELIAAK